MAVYVEQLLADGKPTVKLRLAAIKMLFDWMVTGGVLTLNPAASPRPPPSVARNM